MAYNSCGANNRHIVICGPAALPLPLAVCGNTIVEAPEMCDDGNGINGDGCTQSCQTETFSGPALSCPGNLLQNPDFEDAGWFWPHWTVIGGATYMNTPPGEPGIWQAFGQRLAFLLNGGVSQTVPATPGATYSLSFWGGTHNPADDEAVYLEFLDAGGSVVGPSQVVPIDYDVDTDFTPPYITQYTTSEVAPVGATQVRVRAESNGGSTTKFDGVCLQESGGSPGYTVNVTAIECDDESYLPNRAGGADITPTTASSFMANPVNAAHCHYQSGVGFEWGDDNTTYPPDWNTVTGPVGGAYGWNTLGFTNGSGLLTQFVPYNPATMSGGGFRIREMLPVGYLPFFGVTNVPSVSAEMYCNKDVEAYDNNETFVGYEVPPNPTTLNAHCVAWNVPGGPAVLEVYSVADGVRVPTDAASPYQINLGSFDKSVAGPTQRDFTIKNIGSSPLSYQVNVPGAVSGYYQCTSGCVGANIPPNSTANVTIEFTPSAAPVVDAPVTIDVDNVSPLIGGTDPVQLRFATDVYDNSPVLDVLPGSVNPPVSVTNTGPGNWTVDLGSVAVGSSITRTVALFNDGNMPLSVSYPAIATADFTAPADADNTPDIAPLGDQSYNITFDPQAGGCLSKDVTITTNGYSGGPSVVIHIEGCGTTSPDLSVEVPNPSAPPPVFIFPLGSGSGALNFGTQDIHSGAKTKQIDIVNNGSAPSFVSFTPAAPPFGEPGGVTNIPAHGSVQFTLFFDPDAAIPYWQDIFINATGYPLPFRLTMSGVGTDYPADFDVPASINFGKVVVNKSKDKATTFTNNDAVSLGTPNAQIVGADAAYFTCLPGGCPVPLAFPAGPGASQELNLRFTPDAVRTFNATLIFSGGMGGIDNVSVPITGQGVRPAIKYIEN